MTSFIVFVSLRMKVLTGPCVYLTIVYYLCGFAARMVLKILNV